MLTRLGNAAARWAARTNPWTNVYGTARTLVALASLGTLLFSSSGTLFCPAAGIPEVPHVDTLLQRLGLFGLLATHLELARALAILILAVTASGWRPRLTAPLHWWVAFSFQASATTIDGGDQLCAILALLLLPVALTDPRRWHWSEAAPRPSPRRELMLRLVALSALAVIRLQVAGIYFHASVAKFAVAEWKDGTAMYYWFTDPAFGAPPWLRPFLLPLLENGITVSLMTWIPLALEVALFMALTMPRRRWAPLLVAGIAFHFGIALVQGLVSFSTVMTAALILYLRPVECPFATPLPARRRIALWTTRSSAT